MSLISKLLNLKKHESAIPAVADEENALRDQSSIEKALEARHAGVTLNQCMKVPLGEISLLGTAFSQLVPSMRTITTNGIGYLPVNMEPGSVLKMAKDGTNWGAYIAHDQSSKFVKWAQMGRSETLMPINPGMLMMAAMLANIEKKLDTIQETQLKILSFLEQDKQAEQQGNLNVLTDILDGYKHNWENDQYLRNHHMKVLDIKQNAEKNIIFYQEQIASSIQKLPTVHLNQAVKAAIAQLEKLFSQYRMALYLFSFSSFLEVLLLGNFCQDYLNQVADKVDKYGTHYKDEFGKCHEMIEKFSSDSLESKVLDGIGSASKTLGNLIASNSVLSRGSVDEWLQDSGNKLLKASSDKAAKTAAMFTNQDDIGCELFVDSIQNVARISNQTTDILFDGNNLYLAMP